VSAVRSIFARVGSKAQRAAVGIGRKPKVFALPTGKDATAEALDASIQKISSALQDPMSKIQKQTSDGKPFYRNWTPRENLQEEVGLDLFRAYEKGRIPGTPKEATTPLARESYGGSIRYNAHNYLLVDTALIRSGKPVPIDELNAIALAIKARVENHGVVLSKVEREFLDAYAELVEEIGTSRIVWRDGMVLTRAESKELREWVTNLHNHVYKTSKDMDARTSAVQKAMSEELSYQGRGDASKVPHNVDLNELFRNPSNTPSIIDVVAAAKKFLYAADTEARMAFNNTPMGKLTNWWKFGSTAPPP
jgi:hypothetical protein